ncbi:hypothetical protein Dda_5594 [Drechslerella dactyloides]|uniref:Uncharacterized protein n=1 Tax=Drechslerella dactyloides TaxID=74499 RepID=A0AAD6IYL6_DREDA|nr:hypothetical protein Dda_5594 [Drechslerella dactyloides]
MADESKATDFGKALFQARQEHTKSTMKTWHSHSQKLPHYGYMAMNMNKYGIISTIETTRVFRRLRDDNDPDTSILEYSPAIKWNDRGLESPLAAWLFTAIEAERHGGFNLSIADALSKDQEPNRRFEFDKIQSLQYRAVGMKGDNSLIKDTADMNV